MSPAVSRRFARAPAFAAAVLALAVMAGLACQEVEEEEIPGRAALLTPETSPAVTTAPSPSPSPAPAAADLPPAPEGYAWYVSPASDSGFPLYAVQVPADWRGGGPFYTNPVSFIPTAATYPPGPVLIVQVAEARFLDATPHLFYWNLPHQGGDCQEISRAGQQSSAGFTWDIFTFNCSTPDPDNPEGVITEAGRAAETTAGKFVFSILIKQPPGTTGGDASFQQAVDSLTPR